MVKYASNAFHALKVAFGNEIAALCEQTEVDAEAVKMSARRESSGSGFFQNTGGGTRG